MKSKVGVNFSMIGSTITYKITVMVEISSAIVNTAGAKAAIDGMVGVIEKAAEEYLVEYTTHTANID